MPRNTYTPKIIEIAGTILHETESAYRFDDGTKVVWLPKSQCEWDESDETMQIPEWLAIEKELL